MTDKATLSFHVDVTLPPKTKKVKKTQPLGDVLDSLKVEELLESALKSSGYHFVIREEAPVSASRYCEAIQEIEGPEAIISAITQANIAADDLGQFSDTKKDADAIRKLVSIAKIAMGEESSANEHKEGDD